MFDWVSIRWIGNIIYSKLIKTSTTQANNGVYTSAANISAYDFLFTEFSADTFRSPNCRWIKAFSRSWKIFFASKVEKTTQFWTSSVLR